MAILYVYVPIFPSIPNAVEFFPCRASRIKFPYFSAIDFWERKSRHGLVLGPVLKYCSYGICFSRLQLDADRMAVSDIVAQERSALHGSLHSHNYWPPLFFPCVV